MALASAPSTPNRTGAPAVRRSFTAPSKPLKAFNPLKEAEAQGAETLYAHSSGKIVSFSTSNRPLRHSSVGDTKSEFQDEPVGVLPWASITERTVAAGPLQIYRVLGSVAFLNSGKILQPLLSKSQCWCVDGVSKFVLRIRPHSYYRIELPYETPQEEESVDEMIKALKTILQYEVTPCPFKRGFTVDLPEPPKDPIQKKPWRPKALPQSQMDEVAEESDQPERVDRFDHESLANEQLPGDMGVFREPQTHTKASDAVLYELAAPKKDPLVGDGTIRKAVDTINEKEALRDKSSCDESPNFKTPTRPKPLRSGRTATAPPHLSLRTSPPSTNGLPSVSSVVEQDRKISTFSSSVESFHSFHSPISPLPPSPQSSNSSSEPWPDDLSVAKVRQHKPDTSETTETQPKHELWDLTDASAGEDTEYHSPPDVPQTAKLIKKAVSEGVDSGRSDVDSNEAHVRLRKTRKSRRRSHSPLPSSTNLYSPYSPRAHISGHHLTTAILQRTCSLLLGPPVQLVALMLRIATKITRGILQGTAFGVNNEGQRIPCSWDFSDGSGDDGSETQDEGEDDEDDYGVSLGKTVSGRDVRTREIGGSWEID